jgi:hypothetical protein
MILRCIAPLFLPPIRTHESDECVAYHLALTLTLAIPPRGDMGLILLAYNFFFCLFGTTLFIFLPIKYTRTGKLAHQRDGLPVLGIWTLHQVPTAFECLSTIVVLYHVVESLSPKISYYQRLPIRPN